MAILSKLSDMAKNIGDKANVALETQKLNSKISNEKDAIDDVYLKIGEFYYQQYKSGKKMPEEAAALCVEIDGHNNTIDETKADIERLKAKLEAENAPAQTPAAGGLTCPSCGKANAPGTKFCQECGAKLNIETAPKQTPAEGSCPSCGKVNPPGTKFCRECGAKLPEAAAPAAAEGTCPSCGKVNTPGTKFCRDCGAKLN